MKDEYNFQKPGRIIEYFPDTQTSTVLVSNARTYSNSGVDDEQASPAYLYDVPTFTPGGGGWHMTFPIKAGDPCQLSFSQFGYDHWLFKDEDEAGTRRGNQPQPWTFRRFSLDDGFCQVGWNTIPRAVKNYHANNSEWRNADADQVISLVDDKSIVITSPIKITINAPSVEVNATDTVVNTATATVNSPTTTLVAETLTATVSTSTLFTTPITTFTGNVLVGGAIGSGGQPVPAGGGMAIGGPITSTAGGTFANDVTANGISVDSHDHAGDGGSGSGPSTGPPR